MGTTRFRPETFAASLAGQAGYLFPWIWLPLVALLLRGARRIARGDAAASERFLIAQAVGPIAVFGAVACVRPILPHWPLVGFLSLFPMLGQWWEERRAEQPARTGRQLALIAFAPLALVALILAQTYGGIFQKGGRGTLGVLNAANDPSLDFYGWDEVGRELKRRGLLDQPNTFLFTGAWYHSGHVAYATRGSATPVLCYHGWDARSFRFWSEPDDWIGHDGILISVNEGVNEPMCFERWFARVEPIGAFEVRRAGGTARKIRLYRCVRQLVGFPFDGSKTVEEYMRFAKGQAPLSAMRRH